MKRSARPRDFFDAHVDESEATWEYLDNGENRFKPLTLDPGGATAPGDARPHRLWVIDGNIRLRAGAMTRELER